MMSPHSFDPPRFAPLQQRLTKHQRAQAKRVYHRGAVSALLLARGSAAFPAR
ncbi:hypothetical protein KCP70_06300 [Salmonella enterica subsp. enterica]|nr:hypothetical protein KCP70_06300 [Salmonella enterica subsp. enterica]